MSDLAISALPGAEFEGFATVAEAGLQGMITLRGDLGAVAKALSDVTGCNVPATRKITQSGANAVAWMSPDEVLILCPHDAAPAMETRLREALAGAFATVATVSDARAVFTVTGPAWRDALAKLCPVDFSTLGAGDIRRTRAAQVAAAILVTGPDEVRLICFRSVAQYMFDILSSAASTGSEPALYP
ncbi:MAG: sarcosine oxidase subunit gamma [Natronohydrobacter sp.]|nr:sarcosine oxidase subunit gamma [Natronohydrobacter sp.]